MVTTLHLNYGVRRGTVTACSIAFVEALGTQHTTLRIQA